MITIRCNPYQKGDFIRYLEYVKEKKYEDYTNKKITSGELKYDIQRLNLLISRVNGKAHEDYLDTAAKVYREKSGKIKGDYQDNERNYKL